MPIRIESKRPSGKRKRATVVEAEGEVEAKVVANVERMVDKVVENTRRRDVLSMMENTYGENARRIGAATLTRELMARAKVEAKDEEDVVINHITHSSIVIYLLLLLQDKEHYHLFR